MSFFGGADCSVGGNAVAQLNKHTQQDRSLQRQTQTPAMAGQAFKTDKMASARDMEQFSAGSPFQFQPMRHELNRIQNLPSAWAADFQGLLQNMDAKMGPKMAQNTVQRAPQVHSAHQTSGWASEFQAPQAQPQTQQAPAHAGQMFQSGLARPMVGYRPMAGGMAMMERGAQKETAVEAQEPQQADWDDQFKEIEELSSQSKAAQDGEEELVVDDKYQATFQEVWDLLNLDAVENDFITQQYEDFKRTQTDVFPADMQQWEKDFARYASTRAHFGDYKFEPAETNQFMDLPADQDPYQIGLQLMENGARLSEAALAFEAAIAKNADHVDAWLKLGEVQTQNEKEIAGITALEKCLELHPENPEALMTLAISYINEGYDNAAFATLERWISTKYPQVAERARAANPAITDEDRFTLHKRVTELFIEAAQLSPDHANMDPDVQMGLGVLFYANEDFDKTIDCFKAALSIKPNDAVVWNRLGASLANLNRPEEAVTAYFKALELKPTFVRARYNLGVSCINIGCYKEAAEHLLSGLAMHQVEGQESGLSHNQSLSLLETLKRAFIAMDRRDLLEVVKPGMSLDQFRGEFSF